jgi:hypothetical protein
VVHKEAYLRKLARYVVLDPVRAGMVSAPREWAWSSYRGMIGVQPAPDWLGRRGILTAFGDTEDKAVDRYMRFVTEGANRPSPWEPLGHQMFLGADAFVEAMRRKVPTDRELPEVPQARARPAVKPLDGWAREHADRAKAIAAAYASGG